MKNNILKNIDFKFDDIEKSVVKIVREILNQGIDGAGPLSSSEKLAAEYQGNDKYKTIDERVDAMIRWESTKNFSSGFIAGLGGAVTLPASIPSSIYASWIVQARLAGAIASLYGFSIEDERVRTFVLVSLLGDTAKEVLKTAGVNVFSQMAAGTLKNIPVKLLNEFNKKIGFQLLAIAGGKGAIDIMKIVPVAGGLISGIIDSLTCIITGKTAKKIFRGEQIEEKDFEYHFKFDISMIYQIIKENTNSLRSIDISNDKIIHVKLKRIPIDVSFEYHKFDRGILYFQIMGNPIKKKFLLSRTRVYLNKKIPDELLPFIALSEDIIRLNINGILREELFSLKGIQISDFDIRGKDIMVKLAG